MLTAAVAAQTAQTIEETTPRANKWWKDESWETTVDQMKQKWEEGKGKRVKAKKSVKSAFSKVWGNLSSNYWSWNRRGAIKKWNASKNMAADGKVSLNGQKFEWYTVNDTVMGG